MESAFGADFSQVRVHQGALAADLNGRIQAKAFAVGSDVFFRDGLPDADSSSGQHLLAHELTHTIQQTGGVQRTGVTPGRVQRVDPAISERAGRQLIQRDGDAKSAWTRLGAIKALIEAHTAEANLPATMADRREALRKEVAVCAAEALTLVAGAEPAKDYADYRARIKQLNDQIAARQRTFTDEVDAAEAKAAVAAAKVITEKFASGLAPFTTRCQGWVTEAYAGLRAATTAATADDLAAAVKRAVAAPGLLAKARATFLKRVDEARIEFTKLQTAAGKGRFTGDELTGQIARTEASIAKMLAVLDLLDRDAAGAVVGVKAIEAAGVDVAETAKRHEEATASSARQTKALEAAELKLAGAKKHRDDVDAQAAEADRLAQEATDLAAAAAAKAQQAQAAAASAAQRASALSGSLAFYERHASRAPSSGADDIVGGHRAKAASAQVVADEAKGTSTQEAAVSEQQSALTQTATAKATETRSAASEAGRLADAAAALASEERNRSTEMEQSAAASAHNAQNATDRRGRTNSDQTAVADAYDGLAGAGADAFDRAQLRLALGDASLAALLGRGIPAALLLDCLPTVQSMIGGWCPAECGDVIVRMRAVQLVAPPLMATFHQAVNRDGAVTARRACEVLDCSAGTPLDWFVPNGVIPAVELLEHGWPTDQVCQFLVAARVDAKLDASQTSKVCKLVTDTNLPVTDTVRLLKSEVTGSFLVTNALAMVRRLLTLPAPWTVDHIAQLVKAAGTGCSPSAAQLGVFCDRVAADVCTSLQSIAMMKGAWCTADYLTDVAYVMIRDAVSAGWAEAEIRNFVNAAATKAHLTKVQIERMYQFVQANATITRANAALCLARPSVGDWTMMMDQVDGFVADGNLGTPAAVPGNHSRFRMVGVPATLLVRVDHARVVHFVEGHTYRHYVFTSANIYRGNGVQPSSMWAVGTTPANVRDAAVAAIVTAGPVAQALRVQAGNGQGPGGTFDQVDYANYCVGVQFFAPYVSLMQFFPFGANQADSVPPTMMDAIGHLFNGGI